MPHFPRLGKPERRRFAARGIDPEASCDAFIAEVRIAPPPRLLHDLARTLIVEERHINGVSRHAGMRWRDPA